MEKKCTWIKSISCLLCIGILIICVCPKMVYAKNTDRNVIRVGYFGFDGYHNMDDNGNRSGYGYEYLQQIARYTGWSYEYVGYNKSWSDAQKMLEDGKIDILTSAQKTEEREKIFDFSDEPIGYSSTIFTIKAGNDKYTIDDFSTFNEIRVGMIEGNSRNTDFSEFAVEKGFSYVPVMFNDTDTMVRSLQDESIDAIVTSSLRVTKNEWLVAEFNFSPYYVCVRKGNTSLLNDVNNAIDYINQNNPSLQNELEDKYYATNSGEEIPFTSEERSYIEKYKESGLKLKVLINPDREPLSFYKDGDFAGIYGDTAKMVLDRSGIPYEVVEVSDREEYTKYREGHLADLCMDMRMDYNQAEQEGYRLTDSYSKATVSMVTRDNFKGDVKSVASVKNSDIASQLKNEYYKNADIVYYSTTEECVKAVNSGKQDAVYLYTYVAEKELEKDVRHRLTSTLVPDLTTDFCVGIGQTDDTVLFSILNKSVQSIDEHWVDQCTIAYTETDNDTISLEALVYSHPIAVISLIAFIIFLGGIVILLLYRQSVQKQDKERAKEIQRLFEYVCKDNEKVMEVSLKSGIAKEFSIQDNQLVIDEKPYITENNYRDFMNQSDYEKIEQTCTVEKIDEVIKTGKDIVFEARTRGDDGNYHWYIFTIHGIIPDRSHPYNFMLFKRDIDEIKNMEEKSRNALLDALHVAKEASLAKGNFMSRMSHEIRTPLNAVIGYLSLTEDSIQEPEKVLDYTKKCQSASRHLLNIINDVLDISAIESGKIKIAQEEFDLKNLISTISLMFYNQAKEKNIEFKVEVLDMTEERVIGDQLRLNQILMNLLSNAMKFTPAGGRIELLVEQLQMEVDQVRFRFQVSDTGIGMSEEFMSRIFSPFEQEKAETARKYGGSGLGLSITGNLITMMQGSIDVDSEEGKGSNFTVHLVFNRAQNAEHKNVKGDFSKIRALIVDDESRSCEYMKSLLKRCHVKSDVVFSGEDAIKQMKKREGTEYEYDFCLMDWNMPGINGVETARRIRKEYKKELPIIIASAYDINEIRDEALKAGVNKLISKPLFQSSMFDLLVDTFGSYQMDIPDDLAKKHVDFSGIRVLLAEDNEMNREIAVSILQKSGLVIDTAVNGKDAYEKFVQSQKNTYQLILMDVQMPVMDGHEATRAIRSSDHEQAKTIPILAMTANAFTEDVTAALASGMNDHIAKPVNYDKLYQLLKKYVKSEEK